jgi:ribosomal protein S18 acetylase RimI-like enzyme
MLGRYSVPVRAIPRIIRNKLLFVSTEKVHSPPGSYGRILSIAVIESSRGKGLGKLLVEQGLESLKNQGLEYVKLEVRPDNIPAVKAYTSLGFIQVGKTRDVQGEWLVMLKDLRN